MGFCTACGAPLAKGRTSCAACGAPVPAAAGPATTSPSARGSASAARQAQPDPSASPALYVGPYADPDRYQLVHLRSRGGEGELWRAVLVIDGVPLPVAVKVINEANNDRLDDWSRRWMQQAEILKTLDHPSLVKVRDTFEGPLPHARGMADARTRSLFLIMNWVNGESLVEWVARHPERDLLDSIRIVARIAGAVDYLHSGASTGRPVLHRDIKPANVLIDGSSVCLVDFGFARLLSGEPMTIAGTPYYMAPEAAGGGMFDEASDRYALGATAYYTLVGEPPIPGDFAGMKAKLARVQGAEGRADLADHILAMLHPDPAGRPASSVEWAQSLAVGAVSMSVPRQTPAQQPSAPEPAPPSRSSRKEPKRRRGGGALVGVLALLLLVVAGAGAAYWFVLRDAGGVMEVEASPQATMAGPVSTPSSTPTPVPTPSPTVSETLEPTPEVTPTEEPTPTPAPDPNGLVIMNLSQYAEPLSGNVDTGEATMKTKKYYYSIIDDPWYGSFNDDREQSVEYNVPPGFDTFQATIGLDDSSGSSAKTTFQIIDPITGKYLYGGPGKLVTLKMNQVRFVDLKLPSDILRIKLATISEGSDQDWHVGITPVWGDAQLTGSAAGGAELPVPLDN